MKTSYQYLREMCALPADFNAYQPQADPRNSRVRYLLQALDALGASYETDIFDALGYARQEPGIPCFINILVRIPATDPAATSSIVFLAHHDVAVPQFENANDNTASCANLLELISHLLAAPPARHSIYVVFTDAEEIVSFTRSGASQLARRILAGQLGTVQHCINLELTAHGTSLYWDHPLPGVAKVAGVPIARIMTPFSDATVLRHLGVESTAVLGTLPAEEITRMRQSKYTPRPTWSRCHQASDRLEHARADDMAHFVGVLRRIAAFAPD